MQIEKIKSVKELPNPLITWWENIYWSIWRVWDDGYRFISYTINPQHKSIRKAVPNSWRDLDGILEDVLSAVIISFVEEEKGLDQIQMILESLGKDDDYIISQWGSVDLFWDYYTSRYQDYLRLQSIYTWVKTGKKAMQNYLDSLGDSNKWEEYEKVEQDIYERDSEYLADLVKLRKYLWT
jgi:hypothetical protein